ncbi:DUF3710 domain-containing protein [Corynebacterium tapiri]|uniref:DUF3710 domain-containing protein n=1 Tax=Corynebacterium tapiri TaxID=1448266 RepID=A0A5C4U539_9CORY|nr:DUF3710 domain-containing protein [Corynebacterium tapiri]TNL99193.1 DUF3710 domain-containing protein [Corynebacterium tapiri]
MPMWPFGKKNQDAPVQPAEELPVDQPEQPVGDEPVSGPFDGAEFNIEEFDFSEFSTGVLNLGSMKLPLPKGSQVQVEMGEQGPRMLHIVTESGRITPVAFAAPTAGGQWEEASEEICEGMNRDGLAAEFVDGPFGKEIVGEAGGNVMRVLGADGSRWMLRFTLASPAEKADQLAETARKLMACTFVYRGTDPMLAGTSLPVALPAPLVAQVQQAMQQRQNEAQAQRQYDEQALDEAAEALRQVGNPGAQRNQQTEDK